MEIVAFIIFDYSVDSKAIKAQITARIKLLIA